ncbi:MAG TPA: 5'/3'-nucleotidase SurE [Spirochaetota bacterium]|jgi:5'-nucleotidase|nr:MAG: 5'-nucleotidase SurE [Spirochaetes bacterium ADurb.Bin218]HOK92355.1 5'/3'-nucleotidase SurE [Spirochaetota bacterium]HON15229.1 5'/3'-nucleotidase SurE [Spirochaetota bacterium]HOQ11893.1 5'/3'-nucleotidase SurE [Spirochaetota bacterium]HOV09369.1 5'/3'-nucleotidase SurE [Spirochaetota bacterium]
MKILLTNDDGIKAEGLLILKDVLSKDHDVYVIAPDRERSACSNIFTMRDKLTVQKLDSRTFSVNGFPADCVSLALHYDIIPEVDLVISGINHGPNLGDDIHFSGTVAGARTAFIFGKPGIALSIDSFHRASPNMKEAAIFINNFLKLQSISELTFLNINYPDINKSEIKGVKYTFLSKRRYIDSYTKHSENEKEMIVSLNGTIETKTIENSDDDAIKKGYISITPMTIDATDYKMLEKLENSLN